MFVFFKKLLFKSLYQAFFGPFSFILHFITCAMHIKFEWPLMLLLGIVTLSGWDALDTVSSVSGQTSNSILSERKLYVTIFFGFPQITFINLGPNLK